MIGTAEIEKMSLEEKLETMELLWKSISQQPDQVPSPRWHGEVISERLAEIESGKAKFFSVEEARQRLQKRKP
jgi:putative addiction module component (TIGR02574 family)